MDQNAEDERPNTDNAAAQPKRSMDAGLRARQRVIGAGLKRLFDDVVDENVPDDFQALLGQFDKPQGGGQ